MTKVKARERVREVVYSEDYFIWDGSVDKLVEQFETWRQLAPTDHQDEVQIEFEPEGGYEGSCAVTVKVFYMRDETDIEQEARESYRRRYNEDVLVRERATYEALKLKFEPTKE